MGSSRLLPSLFVETFQTEQSAKTHRAREAARVDGNVATALRLACDHATQSLSAVGRTFGRMLSDIRDKVADRFLSSEASYRGTLLGMRHGYDVFSHGSGSPRVVGSSKNLRASSGGLLPAPQAR